MRAESAYRVPTGRVPLWLAMLAMMIVSTACTTTPARPERGGFVERSVTLDGTIHRYQVFVPARAMGGPAPPVILFLHGSGERGDDNRAQVAVGLGPVVRARSDGFSAIVVFPQAPAGSEWGQVADVVFAQLDAAIQEFDGDADRVVLTGMSMGGYGTWDYAMRAPDRFAALVPVCGGLVHPRRPSMAVAGLEGVADPYAVVAGKLKDVPTWIFHGAQDDVVPPEYSRRMADALQSFGAKDARFTEFPDANHNSWDPAYAQTPALWDWVFQQKRD